MDEELVKAIDDFFDAGDFAELIGATTRELVEAFPDQVDTALSDLLEMMGLHNNNEDNYGEETD